MRYRRRCRYEGCTHFSNDNISNCRFHKFPQEDGRLDRWVALCGNATVTPKKARKNTYICSCHFVGGVGPSRNHPDPVEHVEEEENEDIVPIPDVITVQEASSAVKRKQNDECKESCTPAKRRPSESVTAKEFNTPEAVQALLGLSNSRSVAQALDIAKMAESADLSVTISPSEKQKTPTPKRRKGFSIKGSPWRAKAVLKRAELRKSSRTLEHTTSFEEDDPLAMPINESVESSPQASNSSPHHVPQFASRPCRGLVFDSPDKEGTSKHNNVEKETTSRARESRSIGIQCQLSLVSYELCKNCSVDKFQFNTGLSQIDFEILYKFLGGNKVCDKLKYEYNQQTPKRMKMEDTMSSENKLFMTLIRLRRGLPLVYLAYAFKVSTETASRICYTWVRFMSLQFERLQEAMFVSAAAQEKTKPKCFKPFPNLRVIVDTTEFRIEKPSHFQQQSNTWSQYKQWNSIKFAIGVSCYGGLSYISEGFEGAIKDRAIFQQCNIMDFLEAEDVVMADRGFDVEDFLNEINCELIIPPFLGNRDKFPARELLVKEAISKGRIHVETFIGKIKEFRLIRLRIPNTMLPIASDLVKVCAFLVNFQPPFINWDS